VSGHFLDHGFGYGACLSADGASSCERVLRSFSQRANRSGVSQKLAHAQRPLNPLFVSSRPKVTIGQSQPARDYLSTLTAVVAEGNVARGE
jgi:hypothetical protein